MVIQIKHFYVYVLLFLKLIKTTDIEHLSIIFNNPLIKRCYCRMLIIRKRGYEKHKELNEEIEKHFDGKKFVQECKDDYKKKMILI